MPAVYRPRMHFYNTPITPDFADASHPLNIIRAKYRPGELQPLTKPILAMKTLKNPSFLSSPFGVAGVAAAGPALLLHACWA